ncbi:DNA polymerase III subunit gamma/tau [Candidatus Nesciobacter abundans]|uniref:DNA polymerase III subunit gamma/tau n=1 Tax=Candidatus Nesciobacter abundans TaxID=2601668 RepID=UPI001653D374|nr:DNA polymerase III subunit gamma/tau [Candidatus Nesciobacter abundans]
MPNKMRPRKFSEVVGQEMAVKLLHEGLKKNIIGSVCLLNGPAGTGKTTLARLIAQWNCCENIKDKITKSNSENEASPNTINVEENDLCGQCTGCKDLINGSHPDVLELDGASKTSVDDIRQLLEGYIYRPVKAKKRTYIIDEVHMLSRSAISALLKTLEEPKEYAQFVLATTEIEKLPKTLVSRCFKINLESINKNKISEHIKNVSDKQGYYIEDDAVNKIVFSSKGSMRQALSILEQAAIVFENKIKSENLDQMLGLASSDQVENMVQMILDYNLEGIKNTIDKILENGADPLNFISQILTFIRKKKADKKSITIGFMLAQSCVDLNKSPYPAELLDMYILKAALCLKVFPEDSTTQNDCQNNLSSSKNEQNFSENDQPVNSHDFGNSKKTQTKTKDSQAFVNNSNRSEKSEKQSLSQLKDEKHTTNNKAYQIDQESKVVSNNTQNNSQANDTSNTDLRNKALDMFNKENK